MNFLSFKTQFTPFLCFSKKDILKADSSFQEKQLSRWTEQGLISRISNGYYIFSDTQKNDFLAYYASNKTYHPSYISLESALAHYGLIPEAVFSTTCITTLHKKKSETPLGLFTYTQIHPSLYFGYTLLEYQGKQITMAEPEKAFLDYLYTHKDFNTAGDMESLRINPDIFEEKISQKKLHTYLEAFHNKRLTKRVQLFLKSLSYAEY